ncbi:MAG TPA: CHAP domain-containing protein [Brumimicrobium sp.]|nr:CHAP domain-containing protein [Brumimicrobium sp.]
MKVIILVSLLSVTTFYFTNKDAPEPTSNQPDIGKVIDSLNNVMVYYNGKVGTVVGRNTINGYNLGLKYQCVEFVKRYYYEFYNHKMPDSYGHALSFYLPNLSDGQINNQRALLQYRNPSKTKPQVGDLIVMDTTETNPFGHVAIISEVNATHIEIIQQNPGPNCPSREIFKLEESKDQLWKIQNDRVLGWLRK